jgi:hypothetical protein
VPFVNIVFGLTMLVTCAAESFEALKALTGLAPYSSASGALAVMRSSYNVRHTNLLPLVSSFDRTFYASSLAP